MWYLDGLEVLFCHWTGAISLSSPPSGLPEVVVSVEMGAAAAVLVLSWRGWKTLVVATAGWLGLTAADLGVAAALATSSARAAVARLSLLTARAMRVGQVGSRGEWWRLAGVAEKRALLFFLRWRAPAVQFEVIVPLISHESAGWLEAQYRHMPVSLQCFEV